MRTTNNHDNHHNANQTSPAQQHANSNEIRPIPTLSNSIFPNGIPLSHSKPIKQGNVPDSAQHDEAREKVIPEESIRGRRSGRSCDDRIGLV